MDRTTKKIAKNSKEIVWAFRTFISCLASATRTRRSSKPSRPTKDPSSLSEKKLSSEGSDFVHLKAKGVSLTFVPRAAFQLKRGEPRGDGPYIFAGAFFYPAGAADVDAYVGIAPFGQSAVATREDALRVYGKPQRSMEDDDVFEWDQWTFVGRQVRTYYSDGAQIDNISVSVPMAQRK